MIRYTKRILVIKQLRQAIAPSAAAAATAESDVLFSSLLFVEMVAIVGSDVGVSGGPGVGVSGGPGVGVSGGPDVGVSGGPFTNVSVSVRSFLCYY